MYKGTLIAVKNMEESKKFYHDILGMNVEGDFGANVQLEGGLFLQTLDTWSYFINGKTFFIVEAKLSLITKEALLSY